MKKQTLKIGDYFQQGDVILRVCEKPKKAKKLIGNVVVEGSHDGGNTHSLKGGSFVLLQTGDKKIFINISKQSSIVHPEHKTIELPSACYELVRVLEYDHMLEESKEVVD